MPRANDIETGQPIPEPTRLHKFVAWMWSKYSRKLLLKIGVVTAPIVGMVAAQFGNTPSAQEAIGIGLSALVLGLLDFVVSYVGKRMGYTNLESLQKLSEDQEQPAMPHDANLPGRSAMWEEARRVGMLSPSQVKAIIAKPTSPAEDETALIDLLDLRTSMHRPNIAMPTAAEQEATRAKLYGFSVEVGGEVHDFLDKFAAIQFRNSCRADGKTANLL